MNTVTKTRTVSDPINELLREAREEKGATLDEVSARTRIPLKYVALLEEKTVDSLPNDAYTKIYLKAYAKYLGLDSKAISASFVRQHVDRMNETGDFGPSSRPKHPKRTIPASHLMVTPKLLKGIVAGLVLLGLAFYFTAAVKRIISPPTITVFSPQDGYVTSDRNVTIEGQTESEVTLLINGKTVAPDTDGFFHDSLELQDGLNTIKIIGARKYSEEMVLTRRILVKPETRPTAVLEGAAEDGL